MTALLEFKQKIKGLFAQYEVYMMPFFKFILALVYFVWINSNMGYMRALDNIFVVLILALICSVLPTGMIVFTGCVMMTVHCYALGIEVAGFMLVILLFMLILRKTTRLMHILGCIRPRIRRWDCGWNSRITVVRKWIWRHCLANGIIREAASGLMVAKYYLLYGLLRIR